MERGIRAVDVDAAAVDSVEEMRSEQQIEAARRCGGRKHVEPRGAQAVFGHVPGRCDGIDEVGGKAEQVHDQERDAERSQHFGAPLEEEQESHRQVLTDEHEVGEPAGQVQGGPVMGEEPFVRGAAADAEPGALDLVRSRHVHAVRDRRWR